MSLTDFTRKVCDSLFVIATCAFCLVILLVVADVTLRVLGKPIAWGYEVTILLGATALGFSLPKTTFNRKHVIMEFGITDRFSFLTKLFAVITRLLGIIIFAIFGCMSFLYGNSLSRSAQVSPILGFPDSIGPYLLGVACVVVGIVMLNGFVHSLRKG